MTAREHWFDRLAAAPHTRRQGLKVTLAAAAAMTLPLVRPRPARAVYSYCTKGCIYSRQRYTIGAFRDCEIKYGGLGYTGIAEALLLGSFTGAAKGIGGALARHRCREVALLNEKYEIEATCYQYRCPGFDPYDEYGPCQNCPSINGCQCCPDPSAPSGYTYCSSLSGKCCNPAGGCINCGA